MRDEGESPALAEACVDLSLLLSPLNGGRRQKQMIDDWGGRAGL